MNRKKLESYFLRSLVYGAISLTILSFVLIVIYILFMGVPHLNASLFSLEYNSENLSLFPSLVNTFSTVFLTLLIAIPLGVFSAIYLVEYAPKGNKFVELVRITTETLQGIPSIVYGLFGYLFFVSTIFKSRSILAGSLTLAIMVLPLIMRSSEEALKAVPDSYREGSYGLGAGKLRTVFELVLPSASSGIFAGIVLSIGRIIGETAALIYVQGLVAKIPETPLGAGSTLAMHMYALYSEGINPDQAYAVAVILLIATLILNASSDLLSSKLKAKK